MTCQATSVPTLSLPDKVRTCRNINVDDESGTAKRSELPFIPIRVFSDSRPWEGDEYLTITCVEIPSCLPIPMYRPGAPELRLCRMWIVP